MMKEAQGNIWKQRAAVVTMSAVAALGVGACGGNSDSTESVAVEAAPSPDFDANASGEGQQTHRRIHTVDGERQMTLPFNGAASSENISFEHIQEIYGCGPAGEISKQDLPDTIFGFYSADQDKKEAHSEFLTSLMGNDNFSFLVENAYPNSFSDFEAAEDDVMEQSATKLVFTDEVPNGTVVANYRCDDDSNTITPHDLRTLVNDGGEDLADHERSLVAGHVLSVEDFETWYDQMLDGGFNPDQILTLDVSFADVEGNILDAKMVATHFVDCWNPFTIPPEEPPVTTTTIPPTTTPPTTTPPTTIPPTTTTIPPTTTIPSTTTTTTPSTTTIPSTTTTTTPSTTTTTTTPEKPPCDDIPGNDVPDCAVPDGPGDSSSSAALTFGALTSAGLLATRRKGDFNEG